MEELATQGSWGTIRAGAYDGKPQDGLRRRSRRSRHYHDRSVLDEPVGYGILMAIIAVLHVFVLPFAIGGGLCLVVTGRRGRYSARARSGRGRPASLKLRYSLKANLNTGASSAGGLLCARLSDRERLAGNDDRTRENVGGRVGRYRVGDRSFARATGAAPRRSPAVAPDSGVFSLRFDEDCARCRRVSLWPDNWPAATPGRNW
jgi:hypothetical protein